MDKDGDRAYDEAVKDDGAPVVDESPLTITIRKPWAGLVRNAARICNASEDDVVERFIASSAAYGAALTDIYPGQPASHVFPELQLLDHHLQPPTAIALFNEMKQALIANAQSQLPSDDEVLTMRCEGES